MTTTVSVLKNGEVELPEDFCKRNKIKPGTALRMTEVGGGLYVTAHTEPTEKELRAVVAAAGSLTRPQRKEEADMLRETISEYRAEKRRKG
ncbi:MAG TPA: hypothetical protein VNT99_18965 [Methylomirabilota bacterium]|nr:hypothetical protein [Methylomirabilota bacterium]